MKLSVIVPAFNDEAYIGSTLESIETAAARLRASAGAEVAIIVADNNSSDGAAVAARGTGARMIGPSIARARNAGADRSSGLRGVASRAPLRGPDRASRPRQGRARPDGRTPADSRTGSSRCSVSPRRGRDPPDVRE